MDNTAIFTLLDVVHVQPELFLALAALVLLMVGAFSKGPNAARSVTWLAILTLATTLMLVVLGDHGDGIVVLNGLFRADPFGTAMKALILVGSAVTLIMSIESFEREGIARFEYPVLVLLSTLGMLMMVSANDLMSLYIGLELQSLGLYVMAAIRRDSTKSTEAGLKYFVLGALSSGMLLYGSSMIYGFAGTTNFAGIAQSFGGSPEGPPLGVVIGLVFLIAGLAFKVSAAPFHMWTPDVYEGSPTPVTAFFAAAPKVAAFALFIRVMIGPFGDLLAQWQQIITFLSLLSMLLGAFAAIGQTNIKRLLAYSSIGHMGYALIGLAAGSEPGVRGIVLYMAIYMVTSIGMFGCVLAMRRQGRSVETIGDLAGLSRRQPLLAAAIAIFMFSMAGIPPLAGFFGKFYVFMAAIEAKLYVLAVVGVLSSVVGAFYYLRLIKIMYFDEPEPAFDVMGSDIAVITGVTAVASVVFFLFLSPAVNRAAVAAASLFGA